MQGASRSDPLLADFQPFLMDPRAEWSAVSSVIGARAAALCDDFPIARAMVTAKINGTHGSEGLRFRSLYAMDDEPDTVRSEEDGRRQIEATIYRADPWVDAGGVLSRREVEVALDEWATILGDGYAVRILQPGRSGAPMDTAWRMIHPWRVKNPEAGQNTRRQIDGHAFNEQGRPAGIYVEIEEDAINRFAQSPIFPMGGRTYFVPWTAPDGTPNVIHRRGLSKPGMIRGLSYFAPMILTARLMQGVEVAYVATKRVHASHPMTIKVDDIEAAKAQYAGTKIANLLVGPDQEVTFNDHKFEGTDYEAFINAELRNMCASWGLPYELVVGDHSAKSGASSRSLWQQYWQRCAVWQTEAIEQATRKIDESILREASARGQISLGDDWSRIMRGRYARPPRIMPDPLKEAQAAQLWLEVGRSYTSVFAEAGIDFVEETMQRHQDDALRSEQGVGQAPAEPVDTEPEEPDPVEPEPEPAAPEPAAQAPQFVINMPEQAAPVVNITNHTPAQPAPIVNVAASPPAITVMHPDVNVSVPQQPAPVVHVRNDIPAPVVNVAAPSVTVDNQVVVPQRRVIARTLDDGSVEMSPVDDG
jgi:capsid protein